MLFSYNRHSGECPVLYFGPLKTSNDYRGIVRAVVKAKTKSQRDGNGFQ